MGEATGDPIPNLPKEHPEPRVVSATFRADGQGEAAFAGGVIAAAQGNAVGPAWGEWRVPPFKEYLDAAMARVAGIKKPAAAPSPPEPREVFAVGQAEGHGEAEGSGSRSGGRKRKFAKQVVVEIWGGPPPEHVTNKSVVDQVGDRLKKNHSISDKDIGRDTILRAAGRRPD
jgi:hypothetical protein